ncbi:hypothetical protein ACHAWF_006590 [Thalassiosira exigua]
MTMSPVAQLVELWDHYPPLDRCLIAIGTLALLALIKIAVTSLQERAMSDGNETKRRRRMSFTSVGLGIGSFPPDANVKEPIINAAIYFDKEEGCPSKEDVARMIAKPLLEGYERMSTIPDLTNRVCRPSAHGTVEPSDLVRELRVDGDEEELNKIIVEHCQDALGEGRDDLPWWELLMLRNAGDGPSACVVRVHHVIGDGLALVAAYEKLLTNVDGGPIRSPVNFKGAASSSRGGKGTKKGVLSQIWSLIAATGHCLTLGATKYDDDTVFSKMNHAKMKHSGKREAVIFPTVPLDYVKALKTAAGATVNDVLMTAVSQAIHDYCKGQGDEVLEARGSEVQCRGLLPVGFPRSEDELNDRYEAMRNVWCMVSCDLCVGHADIMDRLRHVKEKTTEMKEKPRAYMQLTIQNNLGPYLPMTVGQQTVFDTFSRHSLVLTNVPGPTEPCLFAGKKVGGVQLFFDNLLTQVDLISYAGMVYGNIVFDADQLPDSEAFGKLYVAALVALGERLGVDVPSQVKEAAL